MKNIALILAGGTGSRFGNTTPKQFIKIEGNEIIKLTVKQFATRNDISQIIVVSLEEYISHTTNLLKEYQNVSVISGGITRTQSSFNGLKFIKENGWVKSFVLIHDASRPFISNEDITQVITSLKQHKAVILGTPSVNTLYQTENGIVKSALERNTVFQAQTPQGFNFETILNCYNKIQHNEHFTDDASALLKYSNTPIHIIQGSVTNHKITFKEDIKSSCSNL